MAPPLAGPAAGADQSLSRGPLAPPDRGHPPHRGTGRRAAGVAPGVPRGSGSTIRLTYNPRDDLGPVWLPDGSGFLYTAERGDRHDLDRCLVVMPRAGGSIEREICDRAPPADD